LNYFFKKIKGQIRRLAMAAAVFGAAVLVLAYFLGYYDFSFLDRYDFLDEMLDEPAPPKSESPFGSLFAPGDLTDTVPDETGAETDGRPAETQPAGSTVSPEAGAGESESVLGIHDTAQLADVTRTIPLVSSLADYSHTTAPYDPSCMTIAKMQFSYKLPDLFSRRRRMAEKVEYVTPVADGEYVAEYRTVREKRPAVDLYMGYILIDSNPSLYLIDSEGTPLCSFSDKIYSPAYTRDTEKRPLFYKTGEDGEKLYYYLSEDGKNFIRSEYNDETDSRGLYFDYPADWGVSDNDTINRVKDEETGLWRYETETGPVTEPAFTNAFAFSEGLACVTADKNRGGMYFISEAGWRVQQTFVTYVSELNRYSIWDYAMPASRGIESLGFFYYDHGLTRVRYQIIDNWNWAMYRRVRVVSDEDRLIRTDGSIYELPAGYNLKGYSEGMILLEKDGLYGFMDCTGGWIADPCYASAQPCISGLAVLETADGRFGMIDREGNIVLPFTYDYISQASGGLIAAYREENGWSVYKVMADTASLAAGEDSSEESSSEEIPDETAGEGTSDGVSPDENAAEEIPDDSTGSGTDEVVIAAPVITQ